ncbi:hypothetical protein GIW81_08425 [Hyphomicrobium sp. xq]|uniref:Uncharacterized protein n=1 Tax=Hyphomicrobium album TaxID=2665159 RepID=A0A6I3KIX3_9HYPH|nr:hypothetical protein [Hyphomicrobium album]MTD94358.1 hypothetical protein [Hyphomicrobium album]
MPDWIRNWFDLYPRKTGTIAAQAGQHASVWPQYLAVAAGVVVEPFLRKYIESGAWSVDLQSLLGRLLFGLIVAIILLPAVYKSSFDPEKPIAVQLAALFPMGIGWQSLVNAAANATIA